MGYTINSSPMLVTKSDFKLIFVMSNHQTCTFPLRPDLSTVILSRWYMFRKPMLAVTDVDIIKQILVKDFSSFVNRRVRLTHSGQQTNSGQNLTKFSWPLPQDRESKDIGHIIWRANVFWRLYASSRFWLYTFNLKLWNVYIYSI